jgi:hypothetical protein
VRDFGNLKFYPYIVDMWDNSALENESNSVVQLLASGRKKTRLENRKLE